MAKYYGKYSCGHEGCINITGPIKDREWKKDREFEKMCPDCRKKYQQKEHERQNREISEKAKEMGLPELKGSLREIAWAKKIRDDFNNDYIRFFEGRKGLDERQQKLKTQADEFMRKINEIDSAKWFIEHRKGYIPLEGGFLSMVGKVWKGEDIEKVLK